MDFLCFSKRWTCPSRPWFSLLNFHRTAYLGCFRSLWPKWNDLLLKLKPSKESTCGLSFHFLSARQGFYVEGKKKKKKKDEREKINSAGWFALRSNVLIVFMHKTSQGNPQQNVSQWLIHSLGTLTVCMKTRMINYQTRSIKKHPRMNARLWI